MSKYVTIETMPEHLRESHRAANNWGVYPHNGAERSIVSRDDAAEIVAADEDEYDHIVGDAPPRYTWRTDAASGEIHATNEHAARAELVRQGEWAAGTREEADIADGAWLTIFDADSVPVLTRGVMP